MYAASSFPSGRSRRSSPNHVVVGHLDVNGTNQRSIVADDVPVFPARHPHS